MTAPTTTDLAAFVTRMLDDDEAAARACESDGVHWFHPEGWTGGAVEASDPPPFEVGIVVYDEGSPTEAQATHIARHDPARVLAQVAALRTILRFHEDENGHDCPYLDDDGDVCTNHFVMPGETCDTLLALAAIWADNPAFDPAWSA